MAIMKLTPTSNPPQFADGELSPEYCFDYGKAKPNRFARRESQPIIVLDPDVAQYFHDSESVNRVLRALILNMPQPTAVEPLKAPFKRTTAILRPHPLCYNQPMPICRWKRYS
jgi:hypothetical protein